MTGEDLTLESMTQHDANGRTVCIHSVCVAKSMRGKGLATMVLREYVERLRQRDDVDRVRLLAADALLPFYENAGFGVYGRSDVVYGSHPWNAVGLELKHPNPGLTFGARPLSAVFVDQTCQADLFCPRAACRSFVLRAEAASLVERDSQAVRPQPEHRSNARSYRRRMRRLFKRRPISRRDRTRSSTGSSRRRVR